MLISKTISLNSKPQLYDCLQPLHIPDSDMSTEQSLIVDWLGDIVT